MFLAFHAARRKPPGSLSEDIAAHLDEHLSIKFLAGSHDVQLCFSCEACEAVLSQQHGAVLPDRMRATAGQQLAPHAAAAPAGSQAVTSSTQQQVQDQQQDQLQDASDASGAMAAAIASLPGSDDMQALLSRARALMAATDLAAAAVEPKVEAQGPAATAAGDVCAAQPAGPGMQSSVLPASSVVAGGSEGGERDERDELQAMMARARAAVAATAVSLQGLGL